MHLQKSLKNYFFKVNLSFFLICLNEYITLVSYRPRAKLSSDVEEDTIIIFLIELSVSSILPIAGTVYQATLASMNNISVLLQAYCVCWVLC